MSRLENPTPWRAERDGAMCRMIYDANDELIGVMDTAELAAQVVFAVNVADKDVRVEAP